MRARAEAAGRVTFQGLHAAAAVPVPPATAAGARPVLLAQVTDDLDGLRDELRRHLEQFGIPVLPAEELPQGGAEFAAAFGQHLVDDAVFVQLLGAYPGRVPRDLPEGYTRFQLEAARRRGLRILQWRNLGFDVPGLVEIDARSDAGPERIRVILDSLRSP
jgi:hypothetical protein